MAIHLNCKVNDIDYYGWLTKQTTAAFSKKLTRKITTRIGTLIDTALL